MFIASKRKNISKKQKNIEAFKEFRNSSKGHFTLWLKVERLLISTN